MLLVVQVIVAKPVAHSESLLLTLIDEFFKQRHRAVRVQPVSWYQIVGQESDYLAISHFVVVMRINRLQQEIKFLLSIDHLHVLY